MLVNSKCRSLRSRVAALYHRDSFAIPRMPADRRLYVIFFDCDDTPDG